MQIKKIYFEGFWPEFDFENNFITNTLRKHYEVRITKDADYLFYCTYNDKCLDYDCVKISFTGENISPDFNVCDYAMGFDYITFEDRYFRFPLWLLYDDCFEKKIIDGAEHTILKRKANDGNRDKFCSFVCSNGNGDPYRTALFQALSSYKQVDSGGRYKNNVGGKVGSKLDFDSQHRFSIACENVSQSGYTTEKIVESFAAGCIPIYWGDPNITEVFNPKAFINCMDYASEGKAAEAVAKIDSNQKLYESMTMEEPFLDPYYVDHCYEALEKFLKNIMEQPLDKAKRNSRYYWKKIYTRKLKEGTRSFRLKEKIRKMVLGR